MLSEESSGLSRISESEEEESPIGPSTPKMSFGQLNQVDNTECLKVEIDSDPICRPEGNSRSTRQVGERRGRPYSHRGAPPPVQLKAKHYTTIWQAQLNYRYAASGCCTAYSTDHLEVLDIKCLVPEDARSRTIFGEITSSLQPNSRSERLFDLLTKLTFARSEPVAKQFFKVYFFVLDEYQKKEQNRPEQSRRQFVDEVVACLYKQDYSHIRENSINSEVQKKQFRLLLWIITYSIVATYEDDSPVYEVHCYKR